jgi:hypothetical protein
MSDPAPKSPLPWKYQAWDRRVRSVFGERTVACYVDEAEGELIVRACNAFPDLLASLQELHAFAAACMRVAVKPEHAEFAAALDAEVAAAGIAEGFGIRAQEAIEKATVTHG